MACITQLESSLSTLETDLTALEEEHSGEDGILKGIETKSDAQWAWHEALLAAWQVSQPQPYRHYVDATAQRDEAWAELRSLESDPCLLAHANAKGKLTQAILNARFKQTEDAYERFLMQRHKLTTAQHK